MKSEHKKSFCLSYSSPSIPSIFSMALLGALLVVSLPQASRGAGSSAPLPGTDCPAFPADSWWHADVSKLPVHSKSAAWMGNMQAANRKLHPDFGPSYGAIPVPYGIPVNVVDGSHPKVPVTFLYHDQSDPGPYPLGDNTPVEGGSYTAPGDRHTITVDKSTCTLYETYATTRSGNTWSADAGAIWNLKSYQLRPETWTSADAAGLPILPGLLRYDEVQNLKIDHAIRFTTNITDKSYLWPARHHAGSVTDTNYPPMGARFRLKASYAVSPTLRPDTKAVLQAMKQYGLVLADNGSPWYFQGTMDEAWPEDLINELKQVPASAFEAVDTSSLMINRNSMQVKEPSILPPKKCKTIKCLAKQIKKVCKTKKCRVSLKKRLKLR